MTKIIIGLSFAIIQNLSFACDVCGCAASSFSMALLPNSRYHIVGYRYSFKNFESKDLHNSNGRFTSKQLFSTSELYGRIKFRNKLQFLILIPIVHNSKKDSIQETNINGLGDFTILSNYVFIDNTDSLSKKVKQSGTLGVGVKLPTGVYQKVGFNEINMLPGTGSYDFLLNLNYSAQYKSVGLQHESSFTFKTENKYHYQFGNSISISQVLFYRFILNEQLKLIPQMGINFNKNWKDIKNGKFSEDTFNGGEILNAQFNLYVLLNKWGVLTQLYLPMYQNLNENLVNQKISFRISLNYFITQKKQL